MLGALCRSFSVVIESFETFLHLQDPSVRMLIGVACVYLKEAEDIEKKTDVPCDPA